MTAVAMDPGATALAGLVLLQVIQLCLNSCPSQTPFWFKKAPELKPIKDEFGEVIADQVWIEFGPIQNHKCVDYFRVESAKTDKFGLVKILSEKIGRYEPGTQVQVTPCTFYSFKVAGYEFFHGPETVFAVWSKETNFTLDYTPKFVKPPIVYEKVASTYSKVRSGYYNGLPPDDTISKRALSTLLKRSIYPYTTTPVPTTTEPFLIITVVWEMDFIDFPICVDRVEFQYLNIEWDESQYTKMYNETTGREGFIVHNKQLPCHEEFAFMVKVFGVNGKFTNTTWNPPSCVSTTPAPTTEGITAPEFERCHSGVSYVFYYLYCVGDY